jgi:hypothetical protein
MIVSLRIIPKNPVSSRAEEYAETFFCNFLLLFNIWGTYGSEFKFRWRYEFLLDHVIQICSVVHLSSYPMGTMDTFPEGKEAGAWSWQLTSK